MKRISKRTQHIPDSTEILYNDPNSFFRASKSVYLHDMQGSSLKTKKPLIEDVKLGMETSSRIIQFINDLDAVDTRFKWISQNLTDVQFAAITIEVTIRELLKYVGLCNASLRALKKSTTIQPEDLQKIYSISESIYDTFDEIKNAIDITNNPEEQNNIIDDILLHSATFQKMMNEVHKLVLSCNDFIQTKNVDTNLNIQTLPIPIDQQELLPEGFVGAGRGSHFNVLSSRVRDIQKQSYKRFL